MTGAEAFLVAISAVLIGVNVLIYLRMPEEKISYKSHKYATLTVRISVLVALLLVGGCVYG